MWMASLKQNFYIYPILDFFKHIHVFKASECAVLTFSIGFRYYHFLRGVNRFNLT